MESDPTTLGDVLAEMETLVERLTVANLTLARSQYEDDCERLIVLVRTMLFRLSVVKK